MTQDFTPPDPAPLPGEGGSTPPPSPPAQPARWADVQAGLIRNVILATAAPDASWRQLPDASTAGPGWTWPANDAAPTSPPPDPRLWWIDVGPFKDRLGLDGLAISVSTHPVCAAVREQLYDRAFVDLQGAQLAQMLGMLKAAAQPTANPVFAGSGPMTDAKILAITTTPTVEAERHIKGLRT